jgi:hypothetical protein
MSFVIVEHASGSDYGEGGHVDYKEIGRVFGHVDGSPFLSRSAAVDRMKEMEANWPTYEYPYGSGRVSKCDCDLDVFEIISYTEGMKK